MNRRFCMIMICLLTLMLAGCTSPGGTSRQETISSQTESSSEADPIDPYAPQNQTIEILDKEGQKLGEIQSDANLTATDMGIFYSAFLSGKGKEWMEYRLFRPETGEDIHLGEAEVSYEATYARQELNGRIYTLIISGYMFDSQPDPMWLLEFDPAAGTMNRYQAAENGFAYTAMTVFKDKLILFNHDQKERLYDRVMEFDPQKGEFKEVLTYELEDSKGSTLRQIAVSDDRLLLLNVRFNSETDVRLMLDIYDNQYRKLEEKDLTPSFRKAAAEHVLAEDVPEEIKNICSRLELLDGRYLFTESFGIVRSTIDLQTDQAVGFDDLTTASKGRGSLFLITTDYDAWTGTVLELREGQWQETSMQAPIQGRLTSGSSSLRGDRIILSDMGGSLKAYYIPAR